MAKRRKRRWGWLWGAGLEFSAGYLSVALLADTAHVNRAGGLAAAVAVTLVLPFASRAGNLLRGALLGVWLGLMAGAGMGMALAARPLRPADLANAAGLGALATTLCCTVAGALFGYLGERRITNIE